MIHGCKVLNFKIISFVQCFLNHIHIYPLKLRELCRSPHREGLRLYSTTLLRFLANIMLLRHSVRRWKSAEIPCWAQACESQCGIHLHHDASCLDRHHHADHRQTLNVSCQQNTQDPHKTETVSGYRSTDNYKQQRIVNNNVQYNRLRVSATTNK